MGLFYLGKNTSDEQLTLYKSKDLTTHAAIIGMTGSGKTGLGIGLIEEAAIDNIPAIVIDPKGDMGNLCLNFPNMNAQDFIPWIDPTTAANKGKTIEQLAQETASMWETGLESFRQDRARVQVLNNVQKTIYTPGSSSGIGVNVLGSFQAPNDAIIEDSDTLSSLINTTVSSLLSLIDIEADPIQSKEHLLLSNIFAHFWRQKIDLTLEDLIGYIASPPFEKIGILSLTTFYAQNERMKLAMLLNNVISSVTFSSWIQGEHLDIQNMMYDENGKAKIAIFSIAHLNDNERMFFVTILLNAYINWMRRQRGSSTLKSILYMDEIFGFFPPTKNPPSKEPMLLLLKQARAFGCGIILSTQNPIDIDYKGLSNIGTWFIGKLQTKQDISKVIDALAAKSDLSKSQLEQQIATIKGRHFILKNIHEDAINEFATRWVLSYLKGPMTKDDIRMLMQSQKQHPQPQGAPQEINTFKQVSNSVNQIKPLVNESIKEYFNDTNINSQAPFYPYIYAQANVRFFNQSRGIDLQEQFAYKLELTENLHIIDWEHSFECTIESYSLKQITNAMYEVLPNVLANKKNLNDEAKALSNYLYTNKKIELYKCKKLNLESQLHQTKQSFLIEVEDLLKEKKEIEIEKLEKKFKTQFERLEDKSQRLHIKLEKEQSDVTAKTTDTVIGIGLTVLGAIFGRKTTSSTTLSKGASAIKSGRGVLKERNDVKNTQMLIQEVNEDMNNLEIELENEIDKIQQQFDIENYEIETLFIKPRRSDITINDIAILWER